MGNPANAANATIIPPPGVKVDPDPNGAMCKAYDKGLRDWCSPNHGDHSNFNDAVFSHLNDDAITSRREVPIGVLQRVPGTNGVPVGFDQIAGTAGHTGAGAASTFGNLCRNADFNDAGMSPNFFRMSGAAATRDALGSHMDIQRVLCPDAAYPDGTAIEIKRPSEPQSHEDQFKNYAKASPTGKCEVVDCAGCKLACPPKGKDCPFPSP